MRKYELMTVFPLDEEKSKKGADDVRSVLNEFGAEIEKEEPFGDRDLTYEIKTGTLYPVYDETQSRETHRNQQTVQTERKYAQVSVCKTRRKRRKLVSKFPLSEAER